MKLLSTPTSIMASSSLLVVVLLASGAVPMASAFVVAPSSTTTSSPASPSSTHTFLSATRPDATEAIRAAREATAKYGATSPEARVAWETVEEMDASDNSAASAGTMDDECELDEEGRSAACEDYEQKKAELAKLLGGQDYQQKMNALKELAQDMKSIKLSVNKSSASGGSGTSSSSAELKEAVAAAKKTADEKGADSDEAKLAWETVEEIASAGLSNAMGKSLDEECLVESAMEACQALDELQKALGKMD